MTASLPPKIITALADLGFVDGLYGGTPYDVVNSWIMTNTQGEKMVMLEIQLNHTRCGEIELYADDSFKINLDMAGWLRGGHRYIINVDLAAAEDKIVAWFSREGRYGNR